MTARPLELLTSAQANAAAATLHAWDDDSGTSGDLNGRAPERGAAS